MYKTFAEPYDKDSHKFALFSESFVVPISSAPPSGHNAFFPLEIHQSGNKIILWPLDGDDGIGTTHNSSSIAICHIHHIYKTNVLYNS